MLRKMHLRPAPDSKQLINIPPPSILNDGVRKLRVRAPNEIRKPPAHNTKSTGKHQIVTRRKQCTRFTKQTLQNWLKIRKQEREEKTQTQELYDVIRNLALTPKQSRELSSAVTNAISSYLETGSLNLTEPPPPSDVSVETPRHSISHIEPEPSTSMVGIIDTPQRTIKEEDGAREYAVQDYGIVARAHVKPYFSRDRKVDTCYGLRREGSNS
jgi:hypothetical protein